MAMLTTEPNDVVRPIHKWMPVILQQNQLDHFADDTAKEEHLKELFQPYPRRLKVEREGGLF